MTAITKPLQESVFSNIVTFKTLMQTIITVLGVCGAILAFIYAQHMSQPHPNALRQDTFIQFDRRVTENFNAQNAAINKINDKIDKIYLEMRK